ncbi:MAG TPA: hypothetical protein VHY20_11440, partial [Pirellulales bacterium]|nr:hypothetical protein [Pirellulales bacterium]
ARGSAWRPCAEPRHDMLGKPPNRPQQACPAPLRVAAAQEQLRIIKLYGAMDKGAAAQWITAPLRKA